MKEREISVEVLTESVDFTQLAKAFAEQYLKQHQPDDLERQQKSA